MINKIERIPREEIYLYERVSRIAWAIEEIKDNKKKTKIIIDTIKESLPAKYRKTINTLRQEHLDLQEDKIQDLEEKIDMRQKAIKGERP